MINASNKSIAFILGTIMSILSWIIIFFNIVLRIVTLNSIGVSSIDTIGFLFTTLLMSAYTFYILFKINNVSYFPILLILMHIATLNGSAIAIIYVIVDIIIMFLLTTESSLFGKNTKTTTYTKSSYTNYYNNNNYNDTNFKKTNNQKADDDDIFDAEYKTK
ncbi:MAG: hypothetical protein LBR40_03730 [Bacilli bacterium]|jgi:glucan phosphoethanolaminetransferase (alkaline phosphatase superfamily)|nr:hypothetical protein [Bacilli bacterium]